jgi:hypothetical protein
MQCRHGTTTVRRDTMTTIRAIGLLFFGAVAISNVHHGEYGKAAICAALAALMVVLEVRGQMRTMQTQERARRRQVIEDALYEEVVAARIRGRR